MFLFQDGMFKCSNSNSQTPPSPLKKRNHHPNFHIACFFGTTPSKHHFPKEIVWTAVRLWGSALESASRRLKEHRQIVLTAVERCGVALRYAVTWQNTLGGGNSNIFGIFTPMIQFDEHIFQMGWNHQLAIIRCVEKWRTRTHYRGWKASSGQGGMAFFSLWGFFGRCWDESLFWNQAV